MALLPATRPPLPLSPVRHLHLATSKPRFSSLLAFPIILRHQCRKSDLSLSILVPQASATPSRSCSSFCFPPVPQELVVPLLQVAAPAVLFFIGLGTASACSTGSHGLSSSKMIPSTTTTLECPDLTREKSRIVEEVDEQLKREFEAWKSKPFALTVPLRIVALQGSFPASWIKDFMQSQCSRMRMTSEFRGNLQSIFTELSVASERSMIEPKSIMAADLVSIGDSWLSHAIIGGLIEPLHQAKDQEWFRNLSDVWKAYLCRNDKGEMDPSGNIWGAPYRWGSMVIAYKKDKFNRMGLPPLQDWGDLFRPELAGKISMVDSPREVVGAVLKYMGASYNTEDIDSQVIGGRAAVLQNLQLLQKQVRLFDSVHYLKAFTAGDVWVAVGWSNDVIATSKRMSNVAVIIPKSGSSLWADLWAVPAATKFNSSDRIGGRVRSPSPLIYQWIEFCLQPSRAFPFRQELICGSSPSALQEWSNKHQGASIVYPEMETNLICGVPPPEILAKCELLEPLSKKSLMDFQWLVAHVQKPNHGWISCILDQFLSTRIKLMSNLHGRYSPGE